MNVQIYVSRRSPDTQKAERFFKERRIPYQLIDLTRAKLGRREIALFAQAVGAANLVDREDRRVRERPVAHLSTEGLILDALLAEPACLRSPIVRSGNRVTVGAREDVWRQWVELEKAQA